MCNDLINRCALKCSELLFSLSSIDSIDINTELSIRLSSRLKADDDSIVGATGTAAEPMIAR